MHLSLQGGWTALMMASKAGHMECVQVLLDKDAKVNIQNEVTGVIHCVHAMLHVVVFTDTKSLLGRCSWITPDSTHTRDHATR